MTQTIPLTRRARQEVIYDWCIDCFGEKETLSVPQRSIRLGEEAIELCQAAGVSKEMVLSLVEHVYSKPKGSVEQEIGGVSICLLAVCNALGRIDASYFEKAEVLRVLSKPFAYFTERNASKNTKGFYAVEERETNGKDKS